MSVVYHPANRLVRKKFRSPLAALETAGISREIASDAITKAGRCNSPAILVQVREHTAVAAMPERPGRWGLYIVTLRPSPTPECAQALGLLLDLDLFGARPLEDRIIKILASEAVSAATVH